MREEAPQGLEVRRRRVRMRSWRRGTREMDLVLGAYADAAVSDMDARGLADFEALLAENDGELYEWIAGRREAKPGHREIVARIRAFHRIG